MSNATDRVAVLLLTVACVCGALACGSKGGGEHAGGRGGPGGPGGPEGGAEDTEAVPVEVDALVRRDMVSYYSTSATLRASRRATVTTRTQGVLESLLVEEGDRVAEGQLLARLEDDEQAIAAERAKSTLETLTSEYQRLQSLFDQELVSEDEYEKARRDYRDAKHAVDLAELELSRTRITAPFAGVVVKRHLDVGNTVTASTPVYELADVTPLHADVNVPERHISRLHAGQHVRLVSDATATAVAAEIERIAPAVDPATGTVKVTLAVDESEELRPGTFVRVDITTDTHVDAVVAPRSALVAEGRRWYIYRVADDGETAEKVQIELGYESEDQVEVHAEADDLTLDAGDRLVVAGAGALEDGSRLDILSGGDEEPAAAAAEETTAAAD